jgi:hypothetical protein
VTHFTDIELQRWHASGPGVDRARVVRHTAECAVCATRYAAAIRAADGGVEVDANEVDDFIAAGRAIGPRAETPRWRQPWALSLVAAAALLVAIVTPRFLSRAADDGPATLRGSAVQTVSPSGAVDGRDLAFVWSSGFASHAARIEVGDAGGVMHSIDAAASPVPLPPTLRERLVPGREYWWTVTLLDDRGAAITRSARRPFAIAGR